MKDKPTYTRSYKPTNNKYEWIEEDWWEGGNKFLNNICNIVGHKLSDVNAHNDPVQLTTYVSCVCLRCGARLDRKLHYV